MKTFWAVVRITMALLVLVAAAATISLWAIENDRALYEKLVQRIGILSR